MPSRSRRAASQASAPSKAWLDSFADAMTLLLAFFVLLFSMSEIDVKKYEAFFEGLNGPIPEQGDGEFEGTPFDPDAPPPAGPDADIEPEEDASAEATPEDPTDIPSDVTESTAPPTDDTNADIEELEEDFLSVTVAEAEDLVAKLDEALGVHLDEDDYAVELDQRGVVVRLADQTLFASGRAELSEEAQDIVRVVADVLADTVDNQVEVEGHTDNRPVGNTEFPSNWELSTARATNVLRAMLTLEDLDPARLAAVGRADTVPRADNDSPEGRAKNRRTEIVVLFPTLEG